MRIREGRGRFFSWVSTAFRIPVCPHAARPHQRSAPNIVSSLCFTIIFLPSTNSSEINKQSAAIRGLAYCQSRTSFVTLAHGQSLRLLDFGPTLTVLVEERTGFGIWSHRYRCLWWFSQI